MDCEIRYVNSSSGNRPPSICDADGIYYTITDASVELFTEGSTQKIVYYKNEKGFNVVTEVDGRELPRDKRPQARLADRLETMRPSPSSYPVRLSQAVQKQVVEDI